MKEEAVIIVGAGPSGIATSACLNRLSIPNILLDRDDCYASLWKKKSYDRLHLHLAKEFLIFPYMPFPEGLPTYLSKKQYVQYLDDYVVKFNVSPLYKRAVESATFDENEGKWHVKATNMNCNECEEYKAKYLVVATGEPGEAFTPEVEGLDSFKGEVLHSTKYKTGKVFTDKNVLVVGCGNSGMEIALDLSNFGAKTSIIARSPFHILSREMVQMGLMSVKYLPLHLVDGLLVMLSKLKYGADLTKYGLRRPNESPFLMKVKYGKYPVIDLGTVEKIKSGHVAKGVLPSIARISGDKVDFANGESHPFDVIVFATGFKRTTHKWLKGDDYLLDETGFPRPSYPNHWKGRKGLYCAGFSRKGLHGAGVDALNIANDIKTLL